MNNEPNEALTRDATLTFYPVSAHWRLPNTFSTKIREFVNKNRMEIAPVTKIFLIANQSAELHVYKNDFLMFWNIVL